MITEACQAQCERKITRVRHALLILCVAAGISAYLVGAVPGGAAPAQGVAGAATFAGKPDANLLQLMRGVMFPESNVIFAGQMDVSTIPHDALPAMSTNPLASVYGGWEAVENSSLALAESAKLLVVPGRTCANGKVVPVEKADWVKYASAMHDAALGAYKAAQTKNADDMVNAASAVSDSCAACHNVYRSNRGGLAGRCTVAPPA
jgi:cytochrome c553